MSLHEGIVASDTARHRRHSTSLQGEAPRPNATDRPQAVSEVRCFYYAHRLTTLVFPGGQ